MSLTVCLPVDSINGQTAQAGHSTELLLTHLTETWRKTHDSGSAAAVVFVDFKKGIDSVSHSILFMKLKRLKFFPR